MNQVAAQRQNHRRFSGPIEWIVWASVALVGAAGHPGREAQQ